MFYSNYGPISYHYQDERQYLQTFPTRVHLVPPLRRFPLEFCNGDRAQKTRMLPLPDHPKSGDMSIHLDTLPALDILTDTHRRTELVKQYHALHALHANV